MVDSRRSLRVLIVDDEPLARSRIRRLLASEPDIDLIGECGDGALALTRMVEEKPDLVFLDIQMPEMNGFEVLAQLPAEVKPVIIFITAYDEYAVRAFAVHAVDYLLKPFDDNRFHEALTHGRQQLVQRKGAGDGGSLTALRKELSSTPLRRLLVHDQGQVRVVAVRDILYISAEDYCVRIHLGTGSCTLRRPLQQLHQELGRERFVRIHRSYLVPLERIKILHPLFKGEYLVELQGGERLPMGARYQKEVLALLSR